MVGVGRIGKNNKNIISKNIENNIDHNDIIKSVINDLGSNVDGNDIEINTNKFNIKMDFLENGLLEGDLLDDEFDELDVLDVGNNVWLDVGVDEDSDNYYIEITKEITYGDLKKYIVEFININYGEINYEIKGGLDKESKGELGLSYYGDDFRYKGDESKPDIFEDIEIKNNSFDTRNEGLNPLFNNDDDENEEENSGFESRNEGLNSW